MTVLARRLLAWPPGGGGGHGALLSLVVLICARLWAAGRAQEGQVMTWRNASDPSALCNDFTRAGFFIRTNNSSNRWVIFLESGSLCYSNDTCNRRFIRREFRGSNDISFEFPFGSFDISEREERLRSNFATTVNPLMTSMNCLDPDLFNEGSTRDSFSVNGTDILDPDPTRNPHFHDYNHVLIPYCSSDLWLGEPSPPIKGECQCGDLECFGYEPNNPRLQFTFRGKTIFQSVIRDLVNEFGMNTASEVVLAGSSAGGVGAFNLAQWLRAEIPDSELLLVLDSSWFINFQDSIFRIFDGTTSSQSSDNQRLLSSILSSHPACGDMSRGFPCCISAECVMTTRNSSGELQFFPENQRTFVITSVYDVFLLAPSLSGLDDFDSVDAASESEVTGLIIDFLRVVGEYGGAMNASLTRTFNDPSTHLSYFLTQCFQHVYFATSTLWGEPEVTVFGSSAEEVTLDLVSFSHSVSQGRWDRLLAVNESGESTSISSALISWYQSRNDTMMRYLDDCQGPYCNDQCPDEFDLGELTTNNWPIWSRILISALLVAIAVICLFLKLLFSLWFFRLEKKQDDYLESLDKASEARLEFPDCDDEKCVAVSCLDLTYTVTFKTTTHVKDERADHTEAIVLNDLADEEDEDSAEGRNLAARQLRRRSRFSQFAETLIKKNSATSLDPEIALTSFSPLHEPGQPPTPPPLPPIIPPSDEEIYKVCGQERKSKIILKRISIYFNPGEMIGIMGPSGCGKTTLLDLLTGRRKIGTTTGDIYVNGIPMAEIRDWYIANTGYVLQLATPYYEELTVRENLTLAAQIKLPSKSKFSMREKFKRVEQVMEVTGLSSLSETVVGGEVGPGLSGGQKRRLVVALQLLKLPSVIFLDEPTSGLDATSSMELLSRLNKLADTNRTVILTIHQPRFEIFHMFHKLVLLSDGKVAYHGAPEKAYEVFVSALHGRYLEKGLIIPSLGEHNPADVIMDMLGNPRFRQILTEYYQDSEEPKLVRRAIKMARFKEFGQSNKSLNKNKSIESIHHALEFALFGARKVGRRHANTFVRMAALEARAAKRIVFNQLMFLPFMFFIFAIVLGTVYLQQTRGFLIVSGMCVFSVASGLFVFPAIELYYTPALRVYSYERADGVGRAQDLVIQGFIRYISIAFVPVIVSTGLIYLLLINRDAYDLLVFLQVVVVNIALNLTWTALLIALMLTFPKIAFRLSSFIASVFGFTSGFFIPIEEIDWWYRWISFINPNYYGFSSVAFFLLEDFNLCDGTSLECYVSSGAFTLRQFNFDKVNPYLHLLILLCFIIFFLFLAVFSNWVRHTSVVTKFKRLVHIILHKPSDELEKEIKKDFDGYKRSISNATSLDDDEDIIGYEEEEGEELKEPASVENIPSSPLYPIAESEEEEEEEAEKEQLTQKSKIRGRWKSMAEKSLQQEGLVTEAPPSESSSADESGSTPTVQAKKVKLNDSSAKRPSKLSFSENTVGGTEDTNTVIRRRKSMRTPFLREGEMHKVWRPKKRPQLADLVEILQRQDSEPVSSGTRPPSVALPEDIPTATPPLSLNVNNTTSTKAPPTTTTTTRLVTPTTSKNLKVHSPTSPRTGSLRTRQKTLFNRVMATQAVLKETQDELLSDEKPETAKPHISLLEASKKVTANLRKQKSNEESKNFSDIVSQYLAKPKPEESSGAETNLESSGKGWSAAAGLMKAHALKRKETKGAIPLTTLREIMREERQKDGEESHLKRRSTGGIPSDYITSSGASTAAANAGTTTPTSAGLLPEMRGPAKLNKISQLKKSVADRRNIHHQPEELTDYSTPTELSRENSEEPTTTNSISGGGRGGERVLSDELFSNYNTNNSVRLAPLRKSKPVNVSTSLEDLSADNCTSPPPDVFVSSRYAHDHISSSSGDVTASTSSGSGNMRAMSGSYSTSALSKLKKAKRVRVDPTSSPDNLQTPPPSSMV